MTGAGDTFFSVVSVGLSKNKSLFESLKLANMFAAKAVSHIGAYVPTEKDILSDMARKVVFTNGCFDVLHEGHLRLLEFAFSKGDYLIVGINSDNSVKRLKGIERPINNQK